MTRQIHKVFISTLAGRVTVRPLPRRALNVVVIIASAVAFGWVASGALSAMSSLGDVRLPSLVGAMALQLGAVFFLMVVWERLIGILWTPGDSTQKPTRLSLYTAYSRSWLARYIPGRIWSLGGRALLANRTGVPVEAVTRSMAIEVIFTYALVSIVAAALLIGADFHILGGVVMLVGGLTIFTASVLIFQKILNRCLSSVQHSCSWLKFTHRAVKLIIDDAPFKLGNTLEGVFVYGLHSCMQLGVILLLAASFANLSVSQAAIIAGAWGVSLTMGWISFVAPVGLGVRDGLAFALFTQVLDVPTASLIVVTSRIMTLCVDFVFVCAVELLALGVSRSRHGIATAVGGNAD